MNAPDRKAQSTRPEFKWDDPLLLDRQLTEEERMVRDTAHAYAQDKLMPRIKEAFRHEKTDPRSSARWARSACSARPCPRSTAAPA